jgi:hypothetical protein
MRDIGDVRSKSIAGKKGPSYQQQILIHNAMGLTTTATHLREFALMIEDMQLVITVSSAIHRSQSIIG